MNGAVIVVGIVGFFVLVIGLMAYSVLIQQPRLQRQLQEESTQHGWTYTPGKSLVVTQRSANGHLLSPKETISERFEGNDQSIH